MQQFFHFCLGLVMIKQVWFQHNIQFTVFMKSNITKPWFTILLPHMMLNPIL